MADDPLILIEAPPAAELVTIRGAEAKYLGIVKRSRPGDRLVVFDGAGRGWLAGVTRLRRSEVEVRILEGLPFEPPPRRRITVAVATVKSARMDWAVEKAAELGASRFIPLETRFCVVEPGEGKLARWRLKALSAAQQSRRLWLMEVAEPQSLPEFLALPAAGAVLWALDFARESIRVAAAGARLAANADLFIAIGPEGGFAPEESRLLGESGAVIIGMGRHPLRTETAVAAVLGALAGLEPES